MYPMRCPIGYGKACGRTGDRAPRINVPPRQVAIGIDPAVAQERPVGAAELDTRQVAVDNDHLFPVI
jgi:hypothetical protein